MKKNNIEIERKFVIKRPLDEDMQRADGYVNVDILQIYLDSPEEITHRVRRSVRVGEPTFYETKKIRIDGISSFEDESEIPAERFYELIKTARADSQPIEKTRHTFYYKGQKFEVDVYMQWRTTCIMETELDSRDTEVEIPPFIKVVKEVTGERQYSNASMARCFPPELK